MIYHKKKKQKYNEKLKDKKYKYSWGEIGPMIEFHKLKINFGKIN
jgi:hypothetical protein